MVHFSLIFEKLYKLTNIVAGSSPTPGVSDVGSTTKRNKNKQREFVLKTKSKRDMVLQKSQIEENNNNDFELLEEMNTILLTEPLDALVLYNP